MGRNRGDHSYFFQLLRSLTAFFALRRFASGGTDGIDTKFRNLMAGVRSEFTGFTIKLTDDDNLPKIEEVNSFLKQNLSCKNLKFDTSNKDQWVNSVSQRAIYNFSKPLTKFLLMASHTNTRIEADTGLPTREDAPLADDREFLTWSKWTSEIYKTIEHVAPQHGKRDDWSGIYEIDNMKNCLGNLVLLPGLQNSLIGNDSWDRKKLFFDMLTKEQRSERKSKLNEAENAGIKFPKTIMAELIDASRSSMLDGVSKNEAWDADHVQNRSKRLSGLCWDLFTDWLE